MLRKIWNNPILRQNIEFIDKKEKKNYTKLLIPEFL